MRRQHQRDSRRKGTGHPGAGRPFPDREQVLRAVEPVVEEAGFEILRLDFSGSRGSALLRIMLDRPEGGVSLEDCSRVSGAVGRLLDGLDLIPCRYHLEVSSPGVDRPLTRPRDFERFVGSPVRVVLAEPLEAAEGLAGGRKNYTGRLTAYDPEADAVVIETEEGPRRLPRSRIDRARLDPELPPFARPDRHRRS